MTEGTNSPLDARPYYVAQVEDAYREREFHNIIGKEYIDDVYYSVDWVPTLLRGPRITKGTDNTPYQLFEAQCQDQQKRQRQGEERSNEIGAMDKAQRRKCREQHGNPV
jgi:hypothetical protein